jgi:hypothetical protein
MGLTGILLLYVAFRAKQLVCDFFLQTAWMASHKGASASEGGLKALFMHAGIHAAFTLGLMLLFAPALWWLGLVDFAVHAGIDRAKTRIVARHNWSYNDTFYWWAFGIDQELHNLTHLVYIVLVVAHAGGLTGI